MAEQTADERRIWSSFGRALSADLRETPSIRGASGLEHPLQALCVDDKNSRIILFSSEPNPRVAALIQGDVQAVFPDSKVIVARPTVLDLGALVRGFFSDARTATLSLPDFKRYTEKLGKLSEKKKARLIHQPNFQTVVGMANAFKNIPMPLLSHVGSLVQQATHIDWMQVFESLKDEGKGPISLTQLYEYDGAAIDREYGVCPVPLYALGEKDWELFLSGTHVEEIQERLKQLNIFQYFFPAPDQLALGLAERGVTDRRILNEIITGAPAQGHPLGAMELIPTARDVHELIDALADTHFVTEIDHSIKVTAEGATARLKVRATPREGVISKFLNRIKLSVNIRASTKDPVYVLGLDANGKPRGARFAELKDNICSAAMDMNCRVLIDQPEAVSTLGMKLPVGRVHGGGKVVKLFVPNIRRELYDQILQVARVAAEKPDGEKPAASEQTPGVKETKDQTDAPQAEVRCISPVTSGLPRSWEEITVGHMVLAHESPDDGWWEAVVINREDEILTLRYRDAPKLPKFIRHINTVALVNPGPT